MNSTQQARAQDRDGLGVTRRLRTADGVEVRIETFPGPTLPDDGSGSPFGRDSADDLVYVVVPGFTQSSRVPRVGRIVGRLRRHGAVVQLDLRGHGRSGGASTIGDDEVHDVESAVEYARSLGFPRVVTLGFSLGAAVVLRHAALHGGVTAVAAVSGPGQWLYRGTTPMRTLHRAFGSRPGRAALRFVKRTRVLDRAWTEPYPLDPAEAAAKVAVPVLIVHGNRDDYFPLHHAWRVHRAGPTSTLWVEPGFGHAESHMTPALTDRIAEWLDDASANGAPHAEEPDVEEPAGEETAGEENRMSTVRLRFWGSLRDATGTRTADMSAATLADAIDEVRRQYPSARVAAILDLCSIMVDERPVDSADRAHVILGEGAVVDLLPPFAGG